MKNKNSKQSITSLLLLLICIPLWSQNYSIQFQGPITNTHYPESTDNNHIDANSNKYSAALLSNDQSASLIPFYIDYFSFDLNGDFQSLIKYRHADANYSIMPKGLITLPNNTQLISGSRMPFDQGIPAYNFIMNINNDGTINWAKEITIPNHTSSVMQLLGDGSVLFIFNSTLTDIGQIKVFCKIDANGTFSNFKRYPSIFDNPLKIVSNTNGTFDLLTVEGNLLNINNDLSAINWTRKYYTEGGSTFNKTANGDYIIATCQTLFENPTIFRTDASGTVIWEKLVASFEGNAANPFQMITFNFIKEDSQGNIIISAQQINSFRSMNIVLDANGNFISNSGTITRANRDKILDNDQYLLMGLSNFPSSNFTIEKRNLGVSYPCDTEPTHAISDGDAMPLTPEVLTLTAISDITVQDISITATIETSTITQSDFCDYSLAVNHNPLPESNITVYPNPTKDIVHINSKQPINTIKLFNYLGQYIKSTNDSSIDISEQSSGIYFIEIESGSTLIRKKIVKE